MTAARILVVLGILFVVLSLLAGFIRYQGLDTPTVKKTADEMIQDQAIRDQVAATLVDSLYANVDVAAQLEQKLPPDAKGLAGPAAAGFREFSTRAAERMLERPRVQELWVNSVGRAHASLLKVLEDDTGAISTEGGAVVLDLQPLVIELGDRVAIVGNVAERLGPDAGKVEVMQADQLETAQDLTQLLKVLGMWLWLVPLALWAAALWIARGRRRSILQMIAIGSILSGLLILILRAVGGSYAIDSLVPSDAVKPAADNAWDILTSLLRDGGLTLLGLGVIVLFAMWLAGPSRSGTATRRALAPYLARPEIARGTAATLFLLLLWWRPTVQTTRVPLMIAAAILLIVGVEILRRQAAREFPDAPPADIGASLRRGAARLRRGEPELGRYDALERLGRLREQGVLTEEEFAAEKAQLVGH
jgi:Short C-terminal domain